MAKFNPMRPTTVANCPTREALERKPGDPKFLTESIRARHTLKKHLNRPGNLQARRDQSQAHASGRPVKKEAKS